LGDALGIAMAIRRAIETASEVGAFVFIVYFSIDHKRS
jgi:hypothetical protein